jgi:hypothetical protein
VNLMAFAERHAPEQRAAMVAALSDAGATRLGDLARRTPHRSWHPSRRRFVTPLAGAAAAALVIAAAAYLLPEGAMTGAEARPDATGQLLAHVPPSFAGSCVPGQDIQRPFLRRLDAAVVCTAAAPSSVDYYQYADGTALDAAFRKVVSGVEELGCGQPETYDLGRLACWKIEGASVLAWTDDRQRILSLAVGRGMQPPELLRWWQLDSGPI